MIASQKASNIMWEHECMSFGESLVAGFPGFRKAL